MSNQTKQKNPKSKETEKTKIRHMFYSDFHFLRKSENGAMVDTHTFWYQGSAQNKENYKFEKLSLENDSPDSNADFLIFLFGIWRLILSA